MQAHVAKCRVGARSLSCILPHVPIGRTPDMNDMAELLPEAVKNREKSFTNRRKWVILRFEI